MRLAALAMTAFVPFFARAYPAFIGYGYTTCVTCHYNTLGHGPLNDYGRALFSQEIAARAFSDPELSDEELAERSGFFPGTELPSWLRPGLKLRQLWFQSNPGSRAAVQRSIAMQTELNLAVPFNEAGDYVAVFTWNKLPENRDLYGQCDGGEACVSSYFREQYVRARVVPQMFVSLGLTDKAYGIRLVDHTAVSRGAIGLGQYDQTHGITLHWMERAWDVAFQWHAGNLALKPEERQKGFSAVGEAEIGEKHRFGASLLSTENETVRWKRFGLHDRWGLTKSPGSSFVWEAGLVQNHVKAAETTSTGTYALAEATINLARGYNFVSTVERAQAEIKSSSPDRSRWTFGLLAFPFQRCEVRADLVNAKNFANDSSFPDGWQIQGQAHVSW